LEEVKLLKEKSRRDRINTLFNTYPLRLSNGQTRKAMVREGKLGKIRKVLVEYPSRLADYLSEREGNAQAAWRTDPKKSGKVL
jgi:hypothetical protein